jgi:microcystin-dependent protein
VSTPSTGDPTGPGFHVTPGEASQIALTAEEQALVTKLLGDPTYFPIEFRRWLEDFIENSDIKISPSQIIGGGAGGGSGNPSLLPAGIILPYATTTFGKDCLLCNGNPVSRTDYQELFDAIGIAWGNGDGSTTFNVPDLRDRALYGIGSVVSLAKNDGKSLGNRGGPNHHHDVSGNTSSGGSHNHSGNTDAQGNHQHTLINGARPAQWPTNDFIQQGTQGSFVAVATDSGQTLTGSGGNHTHGISTNTVAAHQHSFGGSTSGGYGTEPSYAGVQYVITTGKSSTVTP